MIQRRRRRAVRADRARAAAPAAPATGRADRFVVLTVGGIEPRKGSVNLLRRCRCCAGAGPARLCSSSAAIRSRTTAPTATSVIASMADLDLELGRDVVLLGTVPDDEMPEWYRSADAFAFPSVNEGCGLAVLEAMAADLPVVASDIPVLREYLTADRTAVLTRAGDPESLAAGMRGIVVDATLRDDASSRAGSASDLQLAPGGAGTCSAVRRARQLTRPAEALAVAAGRLGDGSRWATAGTRPVRPRSP